jgi:hypothetical protein
MTVPFEELSAALNSRSQSVIPDYVFWHRPLSLRLRGEQGAPRAPTTPDGLRLPAFSTSCALAAHMSTLIPALLTILLYLSMSDFIVAPKCSGVSAIASNANVLSL